MGTTVVPRRGRLLHVGAPAALCAAALACGKGFDASVYPTPDSLYQDAVASFEADDCGKAEDRFRQLIFDLPPRDPRLVDARYYLAVCLHRDGDRLEAAREYRRVADEFPQHPRAPDALVGAAQANAELWKRPSLDPTYGETATAIYRELLARYPNTPAAQRAAEGVAALNEKFAEKTFKSGDFYFRLRAYDSAIIYFRDVVANYPRSTYAPRALVRLVQTYERIGYDEELQETCAHLRQFYPQARDLDEACPAAATSP